ncbi:MAG: CaiB/BaiF CoA-transferase family protein [Dehalococcoidia bacterium]
MGPLDGIRILDFTWALAGPFGTMILCDMGAEVWRIEPVGMTEAERAPGPVVDGVNLYYFSLSRGKQAVHIDLKSDAGREIALSLAEHVDVVTENFSPGTMQTLGLAYEVIAARNPRIIYASTSGFGQTGPASKRGAVDVIVQAMSGLMSITGHPDGPPARAGYSIGDMAAGMFTAIGVLGALVEREKSGRGQYLDVAMLDAQFALLENAMTRYFATGAVPGPIGTRHPLITPFQAFASADGWLVVAGVKDWALFCALLELDALVADERFATNAARTANHAALEPLLSDAFRRRTTDDWIAALEGACLVAPMHTIASAAADPQANHREMFVDVPGGEGGTVRVVNSPLKYSRTKVQVERGADRVGAHTADVLRRVLGMSDERIDDLRRAGVVQTDDDAPDESRRTRPPL